MTLTKILTCDKCNKQIDNPIDVVDASTYGYHFHFDCVAAMSAFDLLDALKLDDIVDSQMDSIIYTSKFLFSSSYGKDVRCPYCLHTLF